MNAFLQALQAKTLEINQSRAKSQQKPHDNNGFNNLPDFDTSVPYFETGVTVKLILDRDRIDLFFKNRPHSTTLDLLRSARWHYRPSDRAWYHKDTEENREFCRQNFSVELESKDLILADDSDQDHKRLMSTINDPILADLDTEIGEIESQEAIKPVPTDRFERYKQQIDDLCDALKICPADLQLIAIERLHKTLFS